MRLTSKLLLSATFPIFFSCGVCNKQVSTVWVNSYKTNCEGVSDTQCLLVQKGDSIDPVAWGNFHSPIEGFEYRPGYIYKLKVKEKNLDAEDVPADASAIQHTLVKVEEKWVDPILRLNDIWVLDSLFGEAQDVSTIQEGQRFAQLEFHISEQRVLGYDGCNNFNGGFATLSEDEVSFGVMAATRKMCGGVILPDLFNYALLRTKRYEIKNLKLYLYDEDGALLMVLRKID
jgi:heat shock protein HslJ